MLEKEPMNNLIKKQLNAYKYNSFGNVDTLRDKNLLEKLWRTGIKMVDKNNKLENNIILNATELAGIVGKNEMNKLSEIKEKNSWQEYRDKYQKASNLQFSDYPIQLDFELNASCNLRCPMYPISAESPKGKGKSTWFDFEFYKKLIDYSFKNGTRAIKLNYINEPLIRNDLIKFIDCIGCWNYRYIF